MITNRLPPLDLSDIRPKTEPLFEAEVPRELVKPGPKGISDLEEMRRDVGVPTDAAMEIQCSCRAQVHARYMDGVMYLICDGCDGAFQVKVGE